MSEAWIGLIGGIAGGIIVAFLTETFSRYRYKIDTYAEWCKGMEGNLIRYAMQSVDCGDNDGFSLCAKRLQLIEHDPRARRLMREIHEAIPESHTEEYQELEAMAHGGGEWDWPPFRAKMSELEDYVRNRGSWASFMVQLGRLRPWRQ